MVRSKTHVRQQPNDLCFSITRTDISKKLYEAAVDHKQNIKPCKVPFQPYKCPSFYRQRHPLHLLSPTVIDGASRQVQPVAGWRSVWRAAPSSTISLCPHTRRLQVLSSPANINLILSATRNT